MRNINVAKFDNLYDNEYIGKDFMYQKLIILQMEIIPITHTEFYIKT